MAQISAKTKEHPEAVSVEYDMPEGLQELVAKFGEETVAAAANAQLTINLQAFMRRHINEDQAKLQELATGWVPGVRGPVTKKTPLERAQAALSSMSAEDRAELLKALKAKG